MFKLLVTICAILVATANAGAPKSSTITAGIKDQTTGLEGLNLKFAIPLKIQDYILGFKIALKDNGNLESLFAKKNFDVLDGDLGINTDFNVKSNVASIDGDWKGFDNTLLLSASANTHDRLKSVGFSKMMTVLENKKVTFAAKYNVLKQTIDTLTSVAVDAAKVSFNYASNDEPKVTLQYAIDDQNVVAPSLTGLGSGFDVAFTRKWDGGSLKSQVGLDKVVKFTWQDSGVAGAWTTEAELPLNDRSGTKVSLARDWTV